MMIWGEGATRGLVGWATRGGGTDPGVLMTPMTPEVSAYLSLPASPGPPVRKRTDEELSTLAPRIIITPPDHEAEYTGVQ